MGAPRGSATAPVNGPTDPRVKIGPSGPATTLTAIEILFVCTGNICRSPMAEALLRERAHARRIDVSVSSAGSLFDGRVAEPGALAAVDKVGRGLGQHRSRVFDVPMIRAADLVLAMEQRHVREICLLDNAAFRKTFTLPDLVQRAEAVGARTDDESVPEWVARAGLERTPSDVLATRPDLEVADPMGGSNRAFRRCATELDGLIGRFVALAWPDGAATGHDALDRQPTPRSV